MDRYIHFQENEDRTITLTVNDGNEELVLLFPYDFETLFAAMTATTTMQEIADSVDRDGVVVPDFPEGDDG